MKNEVSFHPYMQKYTSLWAINGRIELWSKATISTTEFEYRRPLLALYILKKLGRCVEWDAV